MNDQQIDRALTSALRRVKGPAAADVDVRDCVDAERLAAWSAGALSEDDAAGVERHLATCVRCQDVASVFAETAETADPAAAALPATVQAPVSKILRRWMAPLAAAAAVVVWLAWPPPTPPAMPAETMARVQPRAETPPPPPSSALDPTVAPPAPMTRSSQGGTAATTLAQSARDAAAAEQMKAVERSDRSLLQDQRRAEPKPTPPQRAQPSTLPPPPAVPAPPTAAPATASVPLPAPTSVPVSPPAATAPVIAPPPPPAPTAPPPTAAREFRAPAMAESLDPRVVVAQFSSAMPPGVAGGAAAGADRGGRGGGGGVANRQVMSDATSVTSAAPHWRVLASGTVERSTDGGATWSVVLIDPPAQITSGAAPTPTTCWLIGRGGVVLISTSGQPFVRITPPTAADLASIRATSARDATVTTTDGRSFRTTDGGVTWVPV